VTGVDCAVEGAKGSVKVDIKCGTPFEPVNVYKMLQAIDFEAFKVTSLMSTVGECHVSLFCVVIVCN